MTFIKKYRRIKDKWWALPLLLPSLLLSVFSLANTWTTVAGEGVVLFYLPLGIIMAMLVVYGLAALPGIMLGVVLLFTPDEPGQLIAQSLHLLVPALLSWGGYRVFVTRRQNIAYSDARLFAQRLFWQVFCPATLYIIILQFIIWLSLYDTALSNTNTLTFDTHLLIDYQAMLVGTMIGTPLSYLLIRVFHHPRYLRSWFSQLRNEFDPKVTRAEFVTWGAIVAGMVILLLMPMTENSSIFSTNYTLSLLLPVMLWGSMRFGYRLMSLLWALLLTVFIHYYFRYLPAYARYEVQLAIASSCYLVYTVIILSVALLATRQRQLHERARRLAFLDPIVHMPNLRALSRALADSPWSVVCLLRIPELELLGRNYGILLRIQYKQKLAEWLRPMLGQGEGVFLLTGYDLAIRLHSQSHQSRIDELDQRIKLFRFDWDAMPLQPQVGMSYCYVRSPVQHLYLLLGELSTIADLSLATNHPESLQQRGAVNLQRSLKSKVDMMSRLQRALEENRFSLMVQPITGMRGDDYHEILLRMNEENGEYIHPDDFLPIAHEFGLSSRIDLWVVEHVLSFMASHREALRGQRFAINLSPTSVCRAQFSPDIGSLLQKYNIEAWQLIFEITESNSLSNIQQANQTLAQLQKMGCRVAIDDFGTGYASYARLKNVNADILKIDGSFIRNIVSNSLDYQIVASICHLARMKRMLVVAEYVESEEIRSAAIALGIDYLQGFLIGKPEPLESLAVQHKAA
ncbi:sensor domain-containing phosphodiesterase [Yokenella regensburgei]|uniref:sensor domain-containing phosphodiesterase n=1 Tax=Yokenella regensburgei TaxID=158877 RepID=UPI003F17B1F9